jgi:hypothetical protein
LIANCNCSPPRQTPLRIGRSDSSKNPVLASADETLAAYPQIFFVAKKCDSGFARHAFPTSATRRDDVEDTLRAKFAN